MTELAMHVHEHHAAWGWFVPFLWFFLIVGTIWLFKRKGGCGRHRSPGDSVLAERYARGEISEQEYRERKTVLREGARR